MSKLKIRLSEEKDIPYLAKFLMQPGVLPFFPMCNEKEVEDSSRIWISYRQFGCAYTGEYDGEVCGMTNLYLSPFTKAKKQTLFSIIISEEFRNKGIGGEMIDHLIDVAQNEHGIELLHLEVYEDNPAKRLYERKGFVKYGEHPNFLKEPDGFRSKILMQKKLKPRV